jgi:hypothetical protein
MAQRSPTPLVATPRVLLIAAIVIAIAIFVFDSVTPVEVTAGVLYCAVVLMAVHLCRPRGVVIVAVGCMALTVLSHFLSPGDHWETAAKLFHNIELSVQSPDRPSHPSNPSRKSIAR